MKPQLTEKEARKIISVILESSSYIKECTTDESIRWGMEALHEAGYIKKTAIEELFERLEELKSSFLDESSLEEALQLARQEYENLRSKK